MPDLVVSKHERLESRTLKIKQNRPDGVDDAARKEQRQTGETCQMMRPRQNHQRRPTDDQIHRTRCLVRTPHDLQHDAKKRRAPNGDKKCDAYASGQRQQTDGRVCAGDKDIDHRMIKLSHQALRAL